MLSKMSFRSNVFDEDINSGLYKENNDFILPLSLQVLK